MLGTQSAINLFLKEPLDEGTIDSQHVTAVGESAITWAGVECFRLSLGLSLGVTCGGGFE